MSANSEPSPDDSTVGHTLRDAFVGFGDDPEAALELIEPLYAPDVVFQDPIQTLHGREAFLAMNREVVERFPGSTIEVYEFAETPTAIFLTWTMVLRQKIGPNLAIEGVTHFGLRDGRVVLHRDYWDLLGTFMDSVPVVSGVYRTLMAKLG